MSATPTPDLSVSLQVRLALGQKELKLQTPADTVLSDSAPHTVVLTVSDSWAVLSVDGVLNTSAPIPRASHLKATYVRAHLSMYILMESLRCLLVSQSHNSALDKEITGVGWAPSRCCGRLSLASPDMMVALVSPGL